MTPEPASRPSAADDLRRRMRRPQRHRLLHGYPLAAAMPPTRGFSPHHEIAFPPGRGLLVGVLPHPFCNPAVTGCGFCTFPHEAGNPAKALQFADFVIQEIETRVSLSPTLFNRKVTALYFGGGTANMLDPVPFRKLCLELNSVFDLKGAEVTLEGVPAYFLRGKPPLIDVMRDALPARHFRISMGFQTFDEARLKQMGRQAFGTPDTFRRVVEAGHKAGCTVSADLLFNLPGQTADQMRDDVRRAVELGLDHLGLYHLVLFRGLGTAWADDDNLLDALPDNERAAANWVALREQLLGNGFDQTSLTNFERATFRGRPDRYLYEDCSFRPDEYHAVGFGPSAASYAATPDFRHGLKVMNPTTAAGYEAAVKDGVRVWDRHFGYHPSDQRVFWLVRRIAGLEIGRRRYRELFGADPLEHYREVFDAARDAGLIEATETAVRLTPRGMFYSDSLAGTLTRGTIDRIEVGGRGLRGDRHPLLTDVRADENAFAHM